MNLKRLNLRATLFLSAALLMAPLPACSKTAPAGNLPLETVADVPLPGNPTRWDYANLDSARHLLFLAHLGDSAVVVFDTESDKVIASIPDISHVHGVLVVPELHRVYASATGTNQLAVINEDTLKVIALVPAGVYPDGIAYVPGVNKLFVSDETGGTDTVIDAATNRRIATIPLDGEVGNTQYDPVSRRIFANVQTRNDLVEIDPVSDKVISRQPLAGAQGNHGLLIDPKGRLAFIACEGNDKLLVLDMRRLHVIDTFAIDNDPDVVAMDDRLGLLYVASESGAVSVFKVNGRDVTKLGQGWLGSNAHVVAVDVRTHRAYFPLKNVHGKSVLHIMRPFVNGV